MTDDPNLARGRQWREAISNSEASSVEIAGAASKSQNLEVASMAENRPSVQSQKEATFNKPRVRRRRRQACLAGLRCRHQSKHEQFTQSFATSTRHAPVQPLAVTSFRCHPSFPLMILRSRSHSPWPRNWKIWQSWRLRMWPPAIKKLQMATRN